MLVEFTVGNFRSISEKVTLSMIAASIKSGAHGKHLDEENVIKIDEKLSLLKSAAIYGANASGKSNVLTALRAMGGYMINSIHANGENDYPFDPFLLQTGYQETPSHFEIVFLIDKIQFRYGFELSRERVDKEWLYFAPKSREALLFDRSNGLIKTGDYFKGALGLEERLTEKALFLTVCKDFNVKIARQILTWLGGFPSVSGLSNIYSGFTIQCFHEKKNDSEIVDFMKKLDLGIQDLDIIELPFPELENEVANDTRQKSFRVETSHRSYDSSGERLPDIKLNMRKHESSGTQKLFGLSGMLVNVLMNGHILSIDELDANLHPLLTRKLLDIFNSNVTNPKNAQLIFTTHDSNLLDNRLMRRDQIWFTEKNRIGATRLYSLSEIKVRNDAPYEDDYIVGKYGAIPLIGGFEILFGDVRETNGDEE